MFNKKTVFVIGAGASWHYGYPTGETLIRKVITESKTAAELFGAAHSNTLPKFVANRPAAMAGSAGGRMRRAYQDAADECNQLSEKLTQLNPLVIDYFLGQNESLQNVGRFMIAWVLLQCEMEYVRQPFNPNRLFIGPSQQKTKHDDDWYRFILHRLTFDLKDANRLLDNHVHFITFNYDTSLDYDLYRRLSQIELLQKENVVDRFMTERIIHVYGNLRPIPVRGINYLDVAFGASAANLTTLDKNWLMVSNSLDMIYESSRNLKVIDPHDKEDYESEIVRAQQLIQDAQVLYFLGFGFDQNNCRRLGMSPYIKGRTAKAEAILFTNKDDSARVNKEVEKAIFGASWADKFVRHVFDSKFDKSTRDVYDAFALDFGSPEQD